MIPALLSSARVASPVANSGALPTPHLNPHTNHPPLDDSRRQPHQQLQQPQSQSFIHTSHPISHAPLHTHPARQSTHNHVSSHASVASTATPAFAVVHTRLHVHGRFQLWASGILLCLALCYETLGLVTDSWIEDANNNFQAVAGKHQLQWILLSVGLFCGLISYALLISRFFGWRFTIQKHFNPMSVILFLLVVDATSVLVATQEYQSIESWRENHPAATSTNSSPLYIMGASYIFALGSIAYILMCVALLSYHEVDELLIRRQKEAERKKTIRKREEHKQDDQPAVIRNNQEEFDIVALSQLEQGRTSQHPEDTQAATIAAPHFSPFAVVLHHDYLSPPQRRFVFTVNILFLVIYIGGLMYSHIEDWNIRVAADFCIVTIATIGYGNVVPKTLAGRIVLYFYFPLGFATLGFAVRLIWQVVLAKLNSRIKRLSNYLTEVLVLHGPHVLVKWVGEEQVAAITAKANKKKYHHRTASSTHTGTTTSAHASPKKSSETASEAHIASDIQKPQSGALSFVAPPITASAPVDPTLAATIKHISPSESASTKSVEGKEASSTPVATTIAAVASTPSAVPKAVGIAAASSRPPSSSSSSESDDDETTNRDQMNIFELQDEIEHHDEREEERRQYELTHHHHHPQHHHHRQRSLDHAATTIAYQKRRAMRSNRKRSDPRDLHPHASSSSSRHYTSPPRVTPSVVAHTRDISITSIQPASTTLKHQPQSSMSYWDISTRPPAPSLSSIPAASVDFSSLVPSSAGPTFIPNTLLQRNLAAYNRSLTKQHDECIKEEDDDTMSQTTNRATGTVVVPPPPPLPPAIPAPDEQARSQLSVQITPDATPTHATTAAVVHPPHTALSPNESNWLSPGLNSRSHFPTHHLHFHHHRQLSNDHAHPPMYATRNVAVHTQDRLTPPSSHHHEHHHHVHHLPTHQHAQASSISSSPSVSAVPSTATQLTTLQRKQTRTSVQLCLAIVFVFVWLLLSSVIFAYTEDWTYSQSFYFCYVTLTTIGYGDLYPTRSSSSSFFLWFLIIGLGAVLYVFSLIADILSQNWEKQQLQRRKQRIEKKRKVALLNELAQQELVFAPPDALLEHAEEFNHYTSQLVDKAKSAMAAVKSHTELFDVQELQKYQLAFSSLLRAEETRKKVFEREWMKSMQRAHNAPHRDVLSPSSSPDYWSYDWSRGASESASVATMNFESHAGMRSTTPQPLHSHALSSSISPVTGHRRPLHHAVSYDSFIHADLPHHGSLPRIESSPQIQLQPHHTFESNHTAPAHPMLHISHTMPLSTAQESIAERKAQNEGDDELYDEQVTIHTVEDKNISSTQITADDMDGVDDTAESDTDVYERDERAEAEAEIVTNEDEIEAAQEAPIIKTTQKHVTHQRNVTPTSVHLAPATSNAPSAETSRSHSPTTQPSHLTTTSHITGSAPASASASAAPSNEPSRADK